MISQFRLVSVLAVVAIAAGVGVQRSAADKQVPVGNLAFSLTDVAGHKVALSDFKDKKALVIVFTGTECPVSNFYVLRLKELNTKYAGMGVQFLAVNSN